MGSGKVLSRELILAAVGNYYRSIQPLPGEDRLPLNASASGWRDIRHHPFHHDTILFNLRPQPGDGRRDVVSLSLRDSGTDLRKPLREGVSAAEMLALIRGGWQSRRDRGAEERKALERAGLREGGLIGIDRLREDPHLEMHARGG